MDDKKIKKKVINASISVAVAAGAVLGIVGYSSDNSFNPSLSDREYNFNQVHFDGDSDTAGGNNTGAEKDSAVLEKDKNNTTDGMNGSRTAYMFDRSHEAGQTDDDTDIISIRTEDGNNAYQDMDRPDVNDGIYDITGDISSADVIISGGQASDITDSGAGGDTPGDGSDSDSGNNTGGSSSDNDNNYIDRSETAKDPEVDKTKPAISNSFDSKPYDESNIKNEEESIVKVVIQPDSSYEAKSLYKGQSVDEYTIFCMLETYVIKMENDNPVLYLWGKEAFDKYIKITGISYDNGSTWVEDFPVTIPKVLDYDSILINVEYRLSQDSDWVSEQVACTPKDSRLFVLSEQIKNDNETIRDDMIINYDQYPDVDSQINMYKYQNNFIKADKLDSLFPGWMENGKLVPWIYRTQIGRHILQPADFVPLNSMFTVRMKNVWMNNDGVIDDNGSNYCSLQTLVGVDDSSIVMTFNEDEHKKALDVPEYIQAVDFDEWVDVDYINIPDSVIYVKNDGADARLRVSTSYEVSDDNQRYSSENGLLMSKNKKQIIAIPYTCDSITVGSDIEKVVINNNNELSNVLLKADNIDKLPEFDYSYLNNCTITVEDSILDEFIERNYNSLSCSNILVATAGDPLNTYRIGKGIVVNSDKELYKIIGKTGTSVTITDDIKSIKDGSLDNADNVNKLILSGNDNITLEDGSLTNSQVDTILCNNKTQRESILSQLKTAGKEDIAVYIMSVSQEGYVYYSVEKDGAVDNILIKAPDSVKEFNGTVENGSITITQLDSGCFADCSSLTWAILPESVTWIGYEAFAGCTSLQGVLIQTKDTVVIGNRAFEGCTSLRFIASDAMQAVMQDGYDPMVTDSYGFGLDTNRYFFIHNEASGYGANANSLSSIGGIEEFRLINTGGSYMLYGVDYYGTEFALLRSGTDISGDISIPESTMYISNYAFADSGNENGFNIDWSSLTWLFCIQRGAFYNSGISGDININAEHGMMLYDMAFNRCENITALSIDGHIYYLGDQVFNYCSSLKSVKFGYIDDWNGCIHSGLFTGCNVLNTIELENDNPIQLLMFEGIGFQFNNQWTREEEADNIRIIVPEEARKDYILLWRYYVCGFGGTISGSPYIDMWNSIQSELIDWDKFILPDDKDVDKVLSDRLCNAENYLRKMLGMDEVNVPTSLYPFRLSGGLITLAGVPSDIRSLDFSTDDIGLPAGWYIDYIGKNAFEGANALEKVVIADNLAGIYSGAFNNAAANTEKLVLEFSGEAPVQLIKDEAQEEFSFGIANSRLTIVVPDGTKALYISEWSAYIDEKQLESMIIEKGEYAG